MDHKRHNVGYVSCNAVLEDLERSAHDCFRLHGDRRDKGAILVGYRGVFCLCALHVCLGALGFADKLVRVSVHVFRVDLADIRLAVMLRKFMGGPGRAVLVPFTIDASIQVSYGDKEVRSGFSIDRLVTHVDEVLASERSWTVVGHLTFVDDTDLGDVGGNAKSLDKLECG